MSTLSALQVKFYRLIAGAGVFDDAAYRAAHPDVAASGMDPLEHYIVAGESEGRIPCRFFDPCWYASQKPHVPPGFSLLAHYLTSGDAAGLQPFAGIDPAYINARGGSAHTTALATLMRAAADGAYVDPNHLFDCRYYLATNADVAAAQLDPYWHFVVVGADEGRLPCASFSWFAIRERFQLSGSNSEAFRQLMRRWHLLDRDRDGETPSVLRLQQDVTANHRPGPHFQTRARAPRAGVRRACEVYAFYLPQFHRVAENDRWWGAGFTEWSNVVRGVPRFAGHYQPRTPADLGFYDLDDPRTMPAQVDLAKQAGLSGFAFYYYNFGSQRLLERPLERFRGDPSLDLGYYLIWANETWSRRWDGSESEVLVEQTYPDTLADTLAADLVRHFADPRYKRIDGRPLFVIYRAGALPRPADWIAALRAAFAVHGADPILYMAQSFDDTDPRPFGLDGAMEFPPHKYTRTLPTIVPAQTFGQNPALRVWDYDDFVDAAAAEPPADYTLIRTCFPSWDNDSRRQGASSVVHGATPEKFARWLSLLVDAAESDPQQPSMVCINAWNEWGEGAYLEPDRHFGHAFLNAVQDVVWPRTATACGRLILVGHDAFPSGAQRLLLEIGRTLQADFGFELCFLLLRAGMGYDSLLADYQSVAETIVADDPGVAVAALARRGFRHALVNSSASAGILADLAVSGVESVLLVHELGSVFDALGTRDAIAASAMRAIVVPSAAVAAMLAARGIDGASIAVLPQGQYRPLRPVARVRAPGALPTVAGVGYADLRKGIDLFVAACAALAATPDPMRFVWQGDWDPVARAELADVVAPLVVAGLLVLVPKRDSIASTLAAADLFFLSSREDPLPSAAIEAWSTGLPVVAFADAGGIADLIEDTAVLGTIAASFSVTDAVDAMRRALGPGSSSAGKDRAEYVAAAFDWHRYCHALVDQLIALPAVDVAVIGHNHGRFVESRLASLLHQTLPAHRITYYDVASTGSGGAGIVEAIAASAGRVDHVALPANAGRLDRSWLAVAEASTAEFLHIAEGDDTVAWTMLERCVAGLRDAPEAAMAFSAVTWIDADDKILESHLGYPASVIGDPARGGGVITADELLASDFLVKNPILSMSSVVWRRSVLVALLGNHADDFAAMRFAYDWLLYILSARAGHAAVFVAETLCQHRQHASSFAARNDLARHAVEIARLYRLQPAGTDSRDERRRRYLSSLG